MKHGRHSLERYEDNNYDIFSSTKRIPAKRRGDKSNVILSRTPKSLRVYDFVTKSLFLLEMLLVVALIIHATVIQIFPVQYIFLMIVMLGILAAAHMRLLSGKRRFKTKRTMSLVLSLLMFVTSVFGMSYMGLIDRAIGWVTLGDGSINENQVGNIAKHPFIVYLSGLDTRNSGEIADKGLSDVNMIVVVNPQQKRVLMVSTPRDYYVPLQGDPNKMDKLTHAGNYGIEGSMKTLESFYGIEFNYYAKFNFKSVYDIVNAVGGVTVNSEFDFTSEHSYTGKTYTFVKGENQLTGDSALAFARERHSFSGGDRQRGKHQQLVIKAVVEKAISPSMLIPSNIEKMLKAISDNTKTNFAEDEVKKLINYQLGSMGDKWDFESMSVDGTGEYNRAYSTGSTSVYVMRPDMETVEAAKAAIDAVMNGEDLPDTSSDVSSSD